MVRIIRYQIVVISIREWLVDRYLLQLIIIIRHIRHVVLGNADEVVRMFIQVRVGHLQLLLLRRRHRVFVQVIGRELAMAFLDLCYIIVIHRRLLNPLLRHFSHHVCVVQWWTLELSDIV